MQTTLTKNGHGRNEGNDFLTVFPDPFDFIRCLFPALPPVKLVSDDFLIGLVKKIEYLTPDNLSPG
ncbi:MAG: hypothetical protein WBV23_02520, partial [Desulfobaccales bacterium]